MILTVLTDDREGDSLCTPEHGLSLLVEHKDSAVLLDFGQTDRFILNAQKLGIDLERVGTAVLSHGHYDHSNGVKFISGKKIVCNPDCFLKRYSKVNGKYDGIGTTLEEVRKTNEVVLTKEPLEIAPDIFYLGEITRKKDFECKQFPTVLENGQADQLFDDSGVVVKTDRGLVVITGCAHSGICNTVEYAKKITGVDKILAVAGGFHLREVNEDIEKVADYLGEIKAEQLLMGHCTCDEACVFINERLWDKSDIKILGAGRSFEI